MYSQTHIPIVFDIRNPFAAMSKRRYYASVPRMTLNSCIDIDIENSYEDNDK